MNTMGIIRIVSCAAIIVSGAYAQEENKSRGTEADELFNSILLTLPQEMKTQIDSASSIKNEQAPRHETQPACSSSANAGAARDADDDSRFDKLPENVRIQVQKTMREIEQQKQQRMIEFKENSEQKKGK